MCSDFADGFFTLVLDIILKVRITFTRRDWIGLGSNNDCADLKVLQVKCGFRVQLVFSDSYYRQYNNVTYTGT